MLLTLLACVLPLSASQGNQIYVGGLSKSVSRTELKAKFRQFGNIDDIAMKKNYAFITYEENKACRDAIHELHNTRIFGGDRNRVEFAGKPTRRERGSSEGRPRGPSPNDKCHKCNKVGHWARDCPERRRDSRRPREDSREMDIDRREGRCFHCRKRGHKKRDCPELRGGRGYSRSDRGSYDRYRRSSRGRDYRRRYSRSPRDRSYEYDRRRDNRRYRRRSFSDDSRRRYTPEGSIDRRDSYDRKRRYDRNRSNSPRDRGNYSPRRDARDMSRERFSKDRYSRGSYPDDRFNDRGGRRDSPMRGRTPSRSPRRSMSPRRSPRGSPRSAHEQRRSYTPEHDRRSYQNGHTDRRTPSRHASQEKPQSRGPSAEHRRTPSPQPESKPVKEASPAREVLNPSQERPPVEQKE